MAGAVRGRGIPHAIVPDEPPVGLTCERVRIGGADVAVFSWPAVSWSDVLTPAQRDVARLVLAGHSTAAIALLRGSSTATVAKHIESIYRRCGVRSRGELAALAAGRA